MFKSTKVNGGSSRARYLKPTAKELKQLKEGARISSTPFGVIPNINSGKKKKKSSYGYTDFSKDLMGYRGQGPDEFSSFGHSYDSSGHLGRNLNINI